MTSIMPPPRFDETQSQIISRVTGTVADAERAIDGRRGGKDSQRLGADLVDKLKVSVEAGRDMYVRNEKTWEANRVRNPIHIMGDQPPGPDIAIWPGPQESRYTAVVGDDMEANAKATDAAFQGVINALEEAIKPWNDGQVYLWNGELRALNKVVAAYEAAKATYDNDKTQFSRLRGFDYQAPPRPIDPPVVPFGG